MSTYGTMIDRIAAELERSDLGSSSSPGVIGAHINDAIRQYKARNWWFLQEPTSAAKTNTTTASNSYLAYVTGLIQIDTLQVTIGGQLERLTAVEHGVMESLHEGSTSEGQPWHYTNYGARIRLYPTPDDVYTITWTGLFEDATTLAASVDTNDWMTNGELLIRHTARMTILRDYLRDDAGAMACMPGIQGAINELDREHMRRQPTRTLRPSM